MLNNVHECKNSEVEATTSNQEGPFFPYFLLHLFSTTFPYQITKHVPNNHVQRFIMQELNMWFTSYLKRGTMLPS